MFNLLVLSPGTLVCFFEKETCYSSRVLLKSEHVSCSVMSNSLQPMNCSLPGSSVHGILQARMLEWVHIPFSRGSSWPRDRTQFSHIAGGFFTVWASRGAQTTERLPGEAALQVQEAGSTSRPERQWKC